MSRPENFPMFWISSFALISAGESIGVRPSTSYLTFPPSNATHASRLRQIMFCAWTNNGGLAVSLVSAGLTLLAQLNARLIRLPLLLFFVD